LQLPDGEVKARFDELVEAWEQDEVAQKQLQEFEANTREPSAPAQLFEGIEAFMDYNRKRREYWKRREALRRNQEGAAERLEKSKRLIQVLLPRDHALIHERAGNRYVIQHQRGRVITLTRQ
jgi:hypothetical protein